MKIVPIYGVVASEYTLAKKGLSQANLRARGLSLFLRGRQIENTARDFIRIPQGRSRGAGKGRWALNRDRNLRQFVGDGFHGRGRLRLNAFSGDLTSSCGDQGRGRSYSVSKCRPTLFQVSSDSKSNFSSSLRSSSVNKSIPASASTTSTETKNESRSPWRFR